MKFLKYWAIIALLCVVSAVSFYGGREYESYYYNFDSLFEAHQKLKERNNKLEFYYKSTEKLLDKLEDLYNWVDAVDDEDYYEAVAELKKG